MSCDQEIHRPDRISRQFKHSPYRAVFDGRGAIDAKRLKELEKENARLKRIVADQVLGMEILQEALEKKL